MTFDPAFRFFADGHPADRAMDPSDEWATSLKAELRDELDKRQSIYPGRVNKGRMTRAEADKELRVWRGVMQSVDPAAMPDTGVEATWTEQVHGLRREIGLRRHFYPQWIMAGRIDAGEAERKLLLLEQWHDRLWHGVGTAEANATRVATALRSADREDRAAA